MGRANHEPNFFPLVKTQAKKLAKREIMKPNQKKAKKQNANDGVDPHWRFLFFYKYFLSQSDINAYLAAGLAGASSSPSVTFFSFSITFTASTLASGFSAKAANSASERGSVMVITVSLGSCTASKPFGKTISLTRKCEPRVTIP